MTGDPDWSAHISCGLFCLDSEQFVMQGNEGLPVAPLQILIFSTGGGTNPGLRFAHSRAYLDLRQTRFLKFCD